MDGKLHILAIVLILSAASSWALFDSRTILVRETSSGSGSDARVSNMTGNCTAGSFILGFDNTTGIKYCDAPSGSGDITAVLTYPNDYLGNGSGSGDVYLTFNESKLNGTIDSRTGNLTDENNYTTGVSIYGTVIKTIQLSIFGGINVSGSWTDYDTDTDTTYTALFPWLILAGTQFQFNQSWLDVYTAAWDKDSSDDVTSVNINSSIDNRTANLTNQSGTYTNGTGVILAGNTLSIYNLTCNGTQKISSIGSLYNCTADTDTTYTNGTGLTLTATTFALDRTTNISMGYSIWSSQILNVTWLPFLNFSNASTLFVNRSGDSIGNLSVGNLTVNPTNHSWYTFRVLGYNDANLIRTVANITTEERVGIGTAYPTQKLHVQGGIYAANATITANITTNGSISMAQNASIYGAMQLKLNSTGVMYDNGTCMVILKGSTKLEICQ